MMVLDFPLWLYCVCMFLYCCFFIYALKIDSPNLSWPFTLKTISLENSIYFQVFKSRRYEANCSFSLVLISQLNTNSSITKWSNIHSSLRSPRQSKLNMLETVCSFLSFSSFRNLDSSLVLHTLSPIHFSFLISFFCGGDRATFAYFPFSLSSSQFSHFSHHAHNHLSYSYLTVLPVLIPLRYCCLLQRLAFPWRRVTALHCPELLFNSLDWNSLSSSNLPHPSFLVLTQPFRLWLQPVWLNQSAQVLFSMSDLLLFAYVSSRSDSFYFCFVKPALSSTQDFFYSQNFYSTYLSH